MSSDLNHSLEPAFIQLTTTAASGEERKFNMMNMQLVQLIVLLIKLKTGVIKRGRELGNKGLQKNGRWENVVREVGSCGARVVFEVQRNHTKKKNIRENNNKLSE